MMPQAAGRSPFEINRVTFRAPLSPRRRALEQLRHGIAALLFPQVTTYYLDRLLRCGSPLPDRPGKRERCGLTECPSCAMHQRRRVLPAYARASAILNADGLHSVMASVALPPSPLGELRNSQEKLSNAFGRVVRSKAFRGCTEGAIRGFEVVGIEGAALVRPHVHFLVAYRPGNLGKLRTVFPELVARHLGDGAGIEFSSPREAVKLTDFAGYLSKLPSGIDAAGWLALREILSGKNALAPSGCCRDALREAREGLRRERKNPVGTGRAGVSGKKAATRTACC